MNFVLYVPFPLTSKLYFLSYLNGENGINGAGNYLNQCIKYNKKFWILDAGYWILDAEEKGQGTRDEGLGLRDNQVGGILAGRCMGLTEAGRVCPS